MPDLPDLRIVATDFLAHGAVFLILAFLLVYGSLRQYTFLILKNNAFIYTFLFCSLLGMLIEIIQAFVPKRSADPFDFLADIIGIIVGLLFFKLFNKLYLKL